MALSWDLDTAIATTQRDDGKAVVTKIVGVQPIAVNSGNTSVTLIKLMCAVNGAPSKNFWIIDANGVRVPVSNVVIAPGQRVRLYIDVKISNLDSVSFSWQELNKSEETLSVSSVNITQVVKKSQDLHDRTKNDRARP